MNRRRSILSRKANELTAEMEFQYYIVLRELSLSAELKSILNSCV